jgi:quercetin dioxygenase-like cupin family protein
MSSLITSLSEALPIPPEGIASRPLMDLKGGTKLVLFALDLGQEISAHTTPFPAQVLLLAGDIEVMVDQAWTRLAPASQIALPTGLPHGIRALAPSHFLLTMLRGA